jgi:hypothetical protein
MVEKAARGGIRYYWSPQHRDIARGCPVNAEALGPDHASAAARAEFLNQALDAWRSGLSSVKLDIAQPGHGTVGWVFDRYLKSPSFLKRASKRSHSEYRRALTRIEDTSTKTGGKVKDLPAGSITAAAADKIYDKLQTGPRGPRIRQANLSIDIARRAWKVMRRLAPSVVPVENPWCNIERIRSRSVKPAASRKGAYALAYALREMGEPHLGAAVLICFEWHQRPERVIAGDITWLDYRPPSRPDAVQIRHHKTGVKGWSPLEDEQGRLYPELEDYLASLANLGLPIVLTTGERGPARPFSPVYARRRIREARARAGLGSHVSLDSCRHGD